MPSAVPHTGFQHFHGGPACHLCSDSSASRQAAERGMLAYTGQCPTQGHPSNAAAVQYQPSRSVHRVHLQSLAPVFLEGNNSSLAFHVAASRSFPAAGNFGPVQWWRGCDSSDVPPVSWTKQSGVCIAMRLSTGWPAYLMSSVAGPVLGGVQE